MVKDNIKTQKISTLIVSSHSLVLKGIAGHLNLDKIDMLPSATNKLEMILRIQEHNPSVVIINDDRTDPESMDILMTIRSALNEFPRIKILLIIDDNDFDLELDALKMGVRGIITEKFDQEELYECINSVANGGLWFRRCVMEQYITDQQFLNKYQEDIPPPLPSFTKRELEIIQLVANGMKNREIGNQLYISEKTVKHHLTKIFRKLKINKRIQLKGII